MTALFYRIVCPNIADVDLETAPALWSGTLGRIIHRAAKNLVAQAFQPVQKTLCFFGLLNLIKYIIALSSFLKSS
jgi:hypothetical protein